MAPIAGPRITRLTRRPQFLAVAAAARKAVTTSVVVQARRRDDGGAGVDAAGADEVRFGFTATRKLGGAVMRNRARRRIKAAVQLVGPGHAEPGVDYVFIARAAVLERPWAKILTDIEQAIDRALTPAPRR